MKTTGKCPKCGSEDVIDPVELQTDLKTEIISLGTFQKPDAMVFKGRQTSSLRASVCGDCGYVELYALNPQYLKGGRARDYDNQPF